MKRDWEIIRQVLIAIEEDRFDEYLDNAENQKIVIGNTVLLINANFIDGNILSNLDTDEDVHVKCLTWQGHELLDTIRSKPVWDKIKSTALDKGLELTFDTVKLLGAKALALIVGNLG